MEFSARQIAEMIGGTIEGQEDEKIVTVSKIEEAQNKSLTFLANPIYTEYLYTTGASIAIVSTTFIADKPLPKQLTLIRVDEPYTAFAALLKAYDSFSKPSPSISTHAAIHDSVKIGKDVYIGDFVSIAAGSIIGDGCIIYHNTTIGTGTKIGNKVLIHSNVTIYHDSIIGDRCIIHSGVVIGADGFGFAPKSEGFSKVMQIGNVILEENVEVGANTCIDRATLGSTIIRKNVKLDNLIQVAHNVEIGENTVIAAQVGISGSTKIGKNCMIGGQAGINGHITIADGTKIAGQAGIVKTIEDNNMTFQGTPAIPDRDYKRSYLYFMRLPLIKNKVDQLEKDIQKLTNDR